MFAYSVHTHRCEGDRIMTPEISWFTEKPRTDQVKITALMNIPYVIGVPQKLYI